MRKIYDHKAKNNSKAEIIKNKFQKSGLLLWCGLCLKSPSPYKT